MYQCLPPRKPIGKCVFVFNDSGDSLDDGPYRGELVLQPPMANISPENTGTTASNSQYIS